MGHARYNVCFVFMNIDCFADNDEEVRLGAVPCAAGVSFCE